MGRWWRRLAWGGVVWAVAAALAYGFWPRPLDVDVAAVVRGDVQVSVQEDGVTRVREKYVVAAPVAGHLLRVERHAGDVVERNKTVLAVLEPTDPALLDARAVAESEARVRAASAAKQQAQAQLERATEAHGLAQHNLERTRKLLEGRTVTRETFDQAEHQERVAQAEVRASAFALQVATFELTLAEAAFVRVRPKTGAASPAGQFPILAPLDGRVLRVFQESAGPVTAGTRLLELGDLTDLELEIDVLSTDAVGIRPGAPVTIERWGGEFPLTGRVRLVEPSAFLKVSALGVEEQRVNVIADFSDPPARRPTLGDAYRVEARIRIAQATNILKIPAGAVFRRQEQSFVFRVTIGRAELCPVEIGRSNGLETEIHSGLNTGDTVIVYPSDQITTGATVRAR